MTRALSLHAASRRAAASASSATSSSLAYGRRFASTHPDDHHGHDAHDTYQYQPEGFFTPFWRNSIIVGILGYGLYQFAPTKSTAADEKENSLTSYIRSGITSADVWKERNENHLALSVQTAEHKQLTGHAKMPIMRRTQYPGKFEDASPHRQPLGDIVDLSDLKVKTETHMLKPAGP